MIIGKFGNSERLPLRENPVSTTKWNPPKRGCAARVAMAIIRALPHLNPRPPETGNKKLCKVPENLFGVHSWTGSELRRGKRSLFYDDPASQIPIEEVGGSV